MKVTVLARWRTPDERTKFIDEIHEKWGSEISAEFYDGSDYDPCWTFEGPTKKVKEIISTYFQPWSAPMEFDELIRRIELDAIVDGKNMAEDLVINRMPKKKQKKNVFGVHTKIMLVGEYNRFNVELFADKATADSRAAALGAELSEEYAIELADDPKCVEVYILELPIN